MFVHLRILDRYVVLFLIVILKWELLKKKRFLIFLKGSVSKDYYIVFQ